MARQSPIRNSTGTTTTTIRSVRQIDAHNEASRKASPKFTNQFHESKAFTQLTPSRGPQKLNAK